MGLVENRNAVLEALQERPLTREELKAKLAESGVPGAYKAVLRMSDSITWRMIEVDGDATPQFARKEVGFPAE